MTYLKNTIVRDLDRDFENPKCASHNFVAAVEDELKRVNGRATRHAYTSYHCVTLVAHAAERACDDNNLLKKDRIGAVYSCVSGDDLPNAYKHASRIVRTRVTLRRHAGGWKIVAIGRVEGDRKPPAPSLMVSSAAVLRGAVARSGGSLKLTD